MNEIRNWYVGLSDADKLTFLAQVMANLTIQGRAFVDLPAEQRAKVLWGLNELQHQISNQCVGIGMSSERYPEEVFLNIIEEKALFYGLSAQLAWSFEYARSRDYWNK